MQHVKKGPYVPVRVTLSRDIDHDTGELAAPERHIATYEGRTIDAALIWDRLDPISRLGYDQFTRIRETFSMTRPRWPEDAVVDGPRA